MTITPTLGMGSFHDAHMRDECELGPNGPVVSVPPFTLREEGENGHELLGAIPCAVARALLWRTPAGTRYVLLRFWSDEDGTVWEGWIEGDGDAAIEAAVEAAIEDYRADGGNPKPRTARA